MTKYVMKDGTVKTYNYYKPVGEKKPCGRKPGVKTGPGSKVKLRNKIKEMSAADAKRLLDELEQVEKND